MEKLNEYFELLEKIEKVEDALKNLKKYKEGFEESLVADAIESGIEKVELDDRNVKFSYESITSIAGGKKDTEQRQEVLQILSDFGYSEDIKTIKTIDGRKLNSILKSLSPEISQNLIEKKLINVLNKPTIKITKKRK